MGPARAIRAPVRARRITPGETLKTFTKRAVTTLATLALALSGALATAVPATAATSKKVTGPEITTEGTRSTVRVTTKDVKIKKGKFTAKDWLKIHVDVPDSFYYADGTRVDATWWASISYPKGSSTTTCGSGGVTDTYSGDGTYVAGALRGEEDLAPLTHHVTLDRGPGPSCQRSRGLGRRPCGRTATSVRRAGASTHGDQAGGRSGCR